MGTQTFATLPRTATDRPNVLALVVSVGTGDGTVADVGGAFSQATLNNNFRDIADKLNSLIVALDTLGIIDNV